jgi:hypothetical protein
VVNFWESCAQTDEEASSIKYTLGNKEAIAESTRGLQGKSEI